MRIRNDPTNGENPSAIRNQIELQTEDGKEREYQESMIGKSAGENQRAETNGGRPELWTYVGSALGDYMTLVTRHTESRAIRLRRNDDCK